MKEVGLILLLVILSQAEDSPGNSEGNLVLIYMTGERKQINNCQEMLAEMGASWLVWAGVS